MMMRMLEAAGLEILSDGLRAADEDNPKGYYEFERVRKLENDQDWLPQAEGKVVKVVSALLRHLPSPWRYRVIFVEREMAEVLASQKQMLLRRGERTDTISDEKMAASFEKHVDKVREWLGRQPNFEVLWVSHRSVLEAPREAAARVAAFLGQELDVERMAAAVDRSLYRQRSRA